MGSEAPAARGEGSAPAFQPGDQVVVSGLESEEGSRLNGQEGTVQRFVEEKDRFEVRLGEKVVSLRPSSLALAPLPDDSGWAPGDQVRLSGLCQKGVEEKLAAINSHLGLLACRASGGAWLIEVAGKHHLVRARHLRVCTAADEARWSLRSLSTRSQALLALALLATLLLLIEAESACRRLGALRAAEGGAVPGLRVALLGALAPAGSLLWIVGTVAGCYAMHAPLLDPEVPFPQISELGVGPTAAKALYRCGFAAAATLLVAMVYLHRELCLPHLPGGTDGDAGESFTRCGAVAAAGVALQGICLLDAGMSKQSAAHGVGALVFFGGVWFFMGAAARLYLPRDRLPLESSPDYDDIMGAVEEASASALLSLPHMDTLVMLRHRALMNAPLAVFIVPLISQLTERAAPAVAGASSPRMRSMMGLMQWLIVLDFALIFASYGPELVWAAWIPVPAAEG